MKYMRPVLAALALTVTVGSYIALAQQQPDYRLVFPAGGQQ